LLFDASLSSGHIAILKRAATTKSSEELSKQETVSFEKLEEPFRELKILPTFRTTEGRGSTFHQTVGHVFIPRRCTMRAGRCNSVYTCTHAVERQTSIMLLPLISPQSCDGGGGDDDVLNDDP